MTDVDENDTSKTMLANL